ncbi:hypothetical protein F2Q70_00011734 [Brassica cretica]|uniref:Uncharacterized protein n=1 Tax=Brassica cretica TaxID=69181 RepID=A0A8S9LS68_BRACR|nr:hypothetical protein F2Q70_00011734 [Brassica cretica]
MNITTSIALIPPPPPPLIEPPSSSQLRPLPTKPSSQHLSVPPGFAPLFPELPIEERNAALLYISHSDATERQARILRVQQSLAPGFVEPTVAKPIISHDLNKGKGHVFVFQENDRPLKRSSTVTDVPGNHERTPLRAHSNSIYDSSDHEASSASSPPGPTGFLMGSSSGNPPSGTRSEGRKNRRRPQRWKRINKPHLHAASGPDKDDSDTGLCRRYGTWNVQRVRHLFVEEDANYILGLKIDMNRADAVVWGLERNGRNELIFANTRLGAATIMDKARNDYNAWAEVNILNSSQESDDMAAGTVIVKWEKPSLSFVKCNIDASWVNATENTGASWLLLDHLPSIIPASG